MSYQPDPYYEDTAIGRYLARELQKISDELRTNNVDGIQYKIWYTEPDKPRTAQSYYADGTQWDPGSGEGLYIYLSSSAWSKL